jgi:hypothetical protein
MSAAPIDRTPPTLLPLIVENLPLNDLAPYTHAVTWDLEWREGKNGKPGGWTKVPKSPHTGRNARSNDPATWGTVDDVLALYDRFGFVVSDEDPFTFLDVDNGIDPVTGELKPWARRIVAALPGAYWERSTTGTGLKGLVRSQVPRNRIVKVDDGQVELFSSGKFTALTGNRLEGSAPTIGEGQAALDALYAELCPEPAPAQSAAALPELNLDDQTIVERVRQMDKGRRLYDAGDLSLYDGDHSRADLGLLNCLVSAGATDANQLDRIFRNSALMRPKWDRDDYRASTLADALDGTVVPFEGWSQPPTPIISSTTQRKTPPITQDDPSDADPCTAERDTIAALRAEVAALRAENAALSRLQSATMALLRSRELQAGEKIVGLVSLFEAEAATRRGATDPDGWTDTPLERIAESAGCSAKVAGKHQATVATTGLIEAETINRRDPETGVIKKHRRIRLPVPTPDAPAPSLSDRLLALSTATPTRDPSKQRWGGHRTCPDCGDVGTVTLTTVSCKGCGQELSRTTTAQPAETESPIGQDDPSKTRGSRFPIGQLGRSGDVPFANERREGRADRADRLATAQRDLQQSAETQLVPREAPPDRYAEYAPGAD